MLSVPEEEEEKEGEGEEEEEEGSDELPCRPAWERRVSASWHFFCSQKDFKCVVVVVRLSGCVWAA